MMGLSLVQREKGWSVGWKPDPSLKLSQWHLMCVWPPSLPLWQEAVGCVTETIAAEGLQAGLAQVRLEARWPSIEARTVHTL